MGFIHKRRGSTSTMETPKTISGGLANDSELGEPRSRDAERLRDLSAQQWKSGIAAWLGWLFDGLDLQLYILVAGPFVAELLGVSRRKDPLVGFYGSWIQAAFLIGCAVGGDFLGPIADHLSPRPAP